MRRLKHTCLILSFCLLGSFSAIAQTETPDQVVTSFFQTMSPPTLATGALQPTQASAEPSRSLTPMLMFAKAHWSELSLETQATVQPWLARPTDIGATPPSGVTFYPASQETILATANFKFHYLDAAVYTTNTNRATTAFVQQLATEAEKVWAQEINTMAYTAPPSDGVLGGDAKYDIYLVDVGASSIFGYVTSDATAISGAYNGVYSHMVIDNDFAQSQFGYATPLDAGKVTLAHEFFHSIQFGYDPSEFPAFLEQLSTWMEDMVYPTIKDNLNYIGEPFTDTNGNGQYSTGEPFTDRNGNNIRESGSQDYPELYLDSFGNAVPGLEQYGRFLWIRHLSESFGDATISSILNACGLTAGNNTYAGTNSILVSKGSSLSTAFHEYSLWNIDVSRYTNGADYPIAKGDNLFESGAINISSSASLSLKPFGGVQAHLSTVYELVNAPSGTYTFTSSNGIPALTAMVQFIPNGAYTDQPFTLTNGAGSWGAPVGANKVTFAISNVSSTDNNMSWQLTDGVTAPLSALSSTTILSSSGGGGCLAQPQTPFSLIWMFLLLLPILVPHLKRPV